ncbi:MAG: hypothetical protein U0903_15125 [Planctomycetales bacterium]
MSSKITFVLGLLLIAASGCSPLSLMKMPGKHVDKDAVGRGEEQKHRAQYQATRDSRELAWLMRNRVDNGMTLDTVNKIVGEKGKRITPEMSDTDGSAGHSTDGTYRFGPDDQGQTYQLTFKSGRLVDFTRPESEKNGRKLAQKPEK